MDDTRTWTTDVGASEELRGATGREDGGHILTAPIHVAEAEQVTHSRWKFGYAATKNPTIHRAMVPSCNRSIDACLVLIRYGSVMPICVSLLSPQQISALCPCIECNCSHNWHNQCVRT